MSPSPRLHWVDHAKAIGIVLVVVGHTSALPPEVREFIYRFHMPLFFFLAGVLTKPERLSEGFRPWLTRQTRALVVPFLGFFTLSWLWWLLIRNIGEKAKESAGQPWWAPLNGLLWGTGESLSINPPLWFFPALFVTSIAFWGLWRVTRGTRAGLPATAVALIMVQGLWAPLWETILPWNVDLVPWLLVIMAVGYLLRARLETFRPPWWMAVALAGLCTVVLAQTWIRGNLGFPSELPALDINGRLFEGDHRGVAALFALLRVLAIVLALLAIPPNSITARLSRDTIIIFPLHGLWFSVFTGVLSKVFHRGDWKETGGWPAVAVYAIGAIVLSLAVAPLLRRWVPWLVGGR